MNSRSVDLENYLAQQVLDRKFSSNSLSCTIDFSKVLLHQFVTLKSLQQIIEKVDRLEKQLEIKKLQKQSNQAGKVIKEQFDQPLAQQINMVNVSGQHPNDVEKKIFANHSIFFNSNYHQNNKKSKLINKKSEIKRPRSLSI